MQSTSILQDYQNFLRKHRIGIADDDVMHRIVQTIQCSSWARIEDIIGEFPELGVRDSNQNQFSGANSCKLQGARSDAMPQRIVSDEQRRSLQEFTRPKGSQKMDDFCVAPPQCSVKLLFRRRALKSSHFLASKADPGSYPALLRGYINYLLSGAPKLTRQDYQTLSDEELIRRQDLMGLPHGLINPVEVELIIMELIIDIVNLRKFNEFALLDAGCGVGHRLSFFASRKIATSNCIGIDLSDISLIRAEEIANAEKAEIVFRKASVQSLPFPPESIDWIWMIDVLPWVKDWKSALKETGRVLRTGGLLLLIYNQESLRTTINSAEVIQILAEASVNAKTISSRGLNSVFVVGKKAK